jgi:hypothetical protein
MSLPKLYYSISELAERWGVRQSDVIEHIVSYCQIWCMGIKPRSCLIDPVLARRP